jgi:hypothetical protein
MSFSNTVPASVPSVTHSSEPWSASQAGKTARPSPSAASSYWAPPTGPATMSLSSCVPTGVPSVIQTSRPWSLSWAMNSARPVPSATRFEG